MFILASRLHINELGLYKIHKISVKDQVRLLGLKLGPVILNQLIRV